MGKKSARKNKDISHFTDPQSQGRGGARERSLVTKADSEIGGSRWILKRLTEGTTHKEYADEIHKPRQEAGIAEIARYLLGVDRIPKTRAVVKRKSAHSIASKKMEDLQVLNSTRRFLGADELIAKGLGSIYALAYILAEDDFRIANIGEWKNKLVLFDFNHSLKTMTKAYRDCEAYRQVDVRDMDEILKVPRFQPPVWHVVEDLLGSPSLSVVAGNENFNKDKWKVFLKLFLMDDKLIEHLLNEHMAEAKDRQPFVDHLAERFTLIRGELLKSEAFKKVVAMHGDQLVEQIIAEVEQYKREFKPEALRASIFQSLDYNKLKAFVLECKAAYQDFSPESVDSPAVPKRLI